MLLRPGLFLHRAARFGGKPRSISHEWQTRIQYVPQILHGTCGRGLATAAAVRPGQAQKIATKARIVIIGAGAAGTSLANRLVERLEGADITILDPSAEHLYQPGLSLVAAGLKPASYTQSQTADWLPEGVRLITLAAAAVDPWQEPSI